MNYKSKIESCIGRFPEDVDTTEILNLGEKSDKEISELKEKLVTQIQIKDKLIELIDLINLENHKPEKLVIEEMITYFRNHDILGEGINARIGIMAMYAYAERFKEVADGEDISKSGAG